MNQLTSSMTKETSMSTNGKKINVLIHTVGVSNSTQNIHFPINITPTDDPT